MKPENVSVNLRSRATIQFSPEIVSALAAKGYTITHLVMTHALQPKEGEPSVVIEYILQYRGGWRLSRSRKEVIAMAQDSLIKEVEIDPEVEHPDDYDFREEDGLETDLPTGGF